MQWQSRTEQKAGQADVLAYHDSQGGKWRLVRRITAIMTGGLAQPMRIIAIETSGYAGSITLAEGPTHLESVQLPTNVGSAASLAPSLKRLLDRHAWTIPSVSLFGLVVGPGSFTGLRVGFATAKTLAFVANARLAPIDAHEVIAAQADQTSLATSCTELHTAIDAFRGEVFSARFVREDLDASRPSSQTPKAWRRATNAPKLPVEEWLQSLPDNCLVSGPGLLKHGNRLPPKVVVVDSNLWVPQSRTVATLAYEASVFGLTNHWNEVEPNYVRESAAEEKHRQTHGKTNL